MAYFYQGDFDKAISDFNKAIRLKPNAAIYALRGLAYSDQGDFDKAISDFNKAIRGRTKCGYLCTSRTSLFRPGQLGQGD